MKSWPLLTVALEREGDVVAGRQRARRIAALLEFEVADQTRIATAVSEIARNAFGYGEGGRLAFGLEGRAVPERFTVKITDRGPGIANLEDVLSGQYRSPEGLGLGITGARRLMDRFSIAPRNEGGMRVEMAKDLPARVKLNTERLAAISRLLTQDVAEDPLVELRSQNLELIQSLDALEVQRTEALRLNDELETTNKGVVALYAELDQRAAELQILNETLERRVQESLAARAAAEEGLRQSQKMEAIGQLTGGIAHDFNNLLMVIGGSLEMLRRRMPDEPRITRLLDAAQQSVALGATLNQQLLAFARKQDLRQDEIPIDALLPSCMQLLERVVGEDIRLVVEADASGRCCRADSHQLETAILNLAINARDAMPRGGTMTLRADVSKVDKAGAEAQGVAPGEFVVISILDTGAGMPPEIVAQVFEPFFTTKPVGKGTGLGLSQVYGFAKQSGGFIGIESEVGVGTAIHIYLPETLPAESVPAEKVDAKAMRGDASILVVEDSEAVRATTCELLRELGYAVSEADNGSSALKILEAGGVDLVFTDVVLPDGFSGADLAAEIQIRAPQVPVLFTSGYTAQRLDHLHDGTLKVLKKPYTQAQLSEAISVALSV